MISVVVEGASDTGMAEAVIREAGGDVIRTIVKGGKTKLDPLIPKYNRAARRSPYVVFRDSDTVCPRDLKQRLMINVDDVSPLFQLRVVHTMTEGWLLSDRAGFADYFGVSRDRIPRDSESLAHPKTTLLDLCSKSSIKDIRAEVVRPDGKEGGLYTEHLNEFARSLWNVESAASNSESLERAVRAIRALT